MRKNYFSKELEVLTGEIRYKFTNDYLFRIVFQENKEALAGLLCSILRLQPSSITSIHITNPVVPGASIDDKEYRMDINLILNNEQSIDLEMQVINQHNWQNRSLVYLCRQYDDLPRGGEYNDLRQAHQIGLLDFSLFEDHPEFCGTYMLKNVKDGYTYNSNFKITVVELNHINIATEEDIASGLVEWAKLFKATTWEELKMIAANDEAMASAANTAVLYESEYAIQKRMREREDYLREKQHTEQRLAEYEKELEEKKEELAKKQGELAKKQEELAEKKEEIAKKKGEIEDKDRQLQEKDRYIAELEALLREKGDTVNSGGYLAEKGL